MKQKKLIYYFLIVSITFTLFLPVLNLSFAHKKFNIHNISKQKLFSTDNLESLINYFVYKTFDFSLNEPNVIVGKDNFFFLGNGHVNIIDKTNGTLKYNNKILDKWSNKLKKLQDWYENQGIKFVVVVASNKHTIYDDKLPNGISYSEGTTVTDDMVEYSLKKNIHILNLKNSLREAKKDKELYFHSDTHWNNYAASIGYLETMKFLNTIYNKNYKKTKYTMKKIISKGAGDLTNFLKINQFLEDSYENNYDFTFNNRSEFCYANIAKNNKLNECTTGMKSNFNQYVINSNSLNKEKLLYLCDSFGLANSQLYNETFNTVWRFHLSYTNGGVLANFIKENKPDIVIYQIVERDLGNNTIIEDIPMAFK